MKKFISISLVLAAVFFLSSFQKKTSEVGKWLATDLSIISISGDQRDTIANDISEQEMTLEFTADSLCKTSNKTGPLSVGRYLRKADILEVTDSASQKMEKMVILFDSPGQMIIRMGDDAAPLLITMKKI